MSVLMTSHLALLAAFIAVLGFFGLGRLFARGRGFEHEILCSFLALILLAVVLSLRTWFVWAWLPWLVWGALIGGGVVALRALAVTWRTMWRANPYAQNRLTWLLIAFFVALLYVEWLWVALPLYRYDQWTYHLVVAKWVDLLGFMKGPLAVDHVFFTGCYEFLGLLPRALFRDDAFQQGFQDCLTSVFIAGVAARMCFGVMMRESLKQLNSFLVALAFIVMVLFSSGDHEGLSSAKPDFVLMMAASLLLWMCVAPNGDQQKPKRSWLSIGALLGACLAMKITWVHVAIAILPVAVWAAWKDRRQASVVEILIGGVIGASAAGAFLWKNYLIFGNPLHPAQTAIWKSNIWSAGLAEYWRFILKKPENFADFILNFFHVLIGSPARMSGALMTIGGLFVLSRQIKSGGRPIAEIVSWQRLLVFYLIYIGFWGFFYGHGISHRFVSGLPALGLVLTLSVLCWVRNRPHYLVAALVLPFLWGGEIEVTLLRIISAWGQDVAGYQVSLAKSPAALNENLRIIAAHKKTVLGADASYDRGEIVSDSIWNFYGPSVFYDATAPVTRTLMEQIGVDPDHGCAVPFLAARDIRYLWVKDPETLDQWPRSLVVLMRDAQSLPIPHGTLWYLGDPSKISCNNREANLDALSK